MPNPEMPSATALGVVDSAVHPSVSSGDDLREYMDAPWNRRSFPGPEEYVFVRPEGSYRDDSSPSNGLPGSDPRLVEDALFEQCGIDYAILLPTTRGLLPNIDLGTAICAATNNWLVDKWLTDFNSHRRFRGSIRVNPADPVAAAEEIRRWADHPLMVQVGVPMQAHRPYGQRFYFPIWEAAAAEGLPVAVHVDGGRSVEFPHTGAGPPRLSLEYRTLFPYTFAFHLASLIVEGVFERLGDLVFVFADGGFEMLPPIIWRLDKDWRPNRDDVPWVTRLPSAYLKDHVRFCAHRLGTPDTQAMEEHWLKTGDGENLLLFASNYPQWDFLHPQQLSERFDKELSERILWDNPASLYALP